MLPDPCPTPKQADTLVAEMTELQRSHAELRAAVMLAGKEIRKLNFGKADSPVLATLRRALRDSRAVARKEGITVRVPAGPAGARLVTVRRSGLYSFAGSLSLIG